MYHMYKSFLCAADHAQISNKLYISINLVIMYNPKANICIIIIIFLRRILTATTRPTKQNVRKGTQHLFLEQILKMYLIFARPFLSVPLTYYIRIRVRVRVCLWLASLYILAYAHLRVCNIKDATSNTYLKG